MQIHLEKKFSCYVFLRTTEAIEVTQEIYRYNSPRGITCATTEKASHLQNSHEAPQQANNYVKKVTFDQTYSTKTASNSEHSEHLLESQVSGQASPVTETEKLSQQQQPSVLREFFTQIMVNPMQLQEHEFTAWLDRLVEARRN